MSPLELIIKSDFGVVAKTYSRVLLLVLVLLGGWALGVENPAGSSTEWMNEWTKRNGWDSELLFRNVCFVFPFPPVPSTARIYSWLLLSRSLLDGVGQEALNCINIHNINIEFCVGRTNERTHQEFIDCIRALLNDDAPPPVAIVGVEVRAGRSGFRKRTICDTREMFNDSFEYVSQNYLPFRPQFACNLFVLIFKFRSSCGRWWLWITEEIGHPHQSDRFAFLIF